MRRRVIAGMVLLLIPWIMSLIWMRADGETIGVDGWEAGAEIEAAETIEESLLEEDEAEQKKILVQRNGIHTYMTLEDYLPGVIACQIDPSCTMEALKCQAVIARTYICRLMDAGNEIHEEELDLDYLEQGTGSYCRPGESDIWTQEKIALSLERCRQATEATRGVVMLYEERCILPLFHVSNNGRTRNGGVEYPYLQISESLWDIKKEESVKSFDWSLQQFTARINQIPDSHAVAADQVADQIQTVQKDDSGYVLKMKIGAKTYTGEEIQYALGLPSTCFVLEETADGIHALVRGIGHGYGLSQTGADAMAQEGWGYTEILGHYYTGITISS